MLAAPILRALGQIELILHGISQERHQLMLQAQNRGEASAQVNVKGLIFSKHKKPEQSGTV